MSSQEKANAILRRLWPESEGYLTEFMRDPAQVSTLTAFLQIGASASIEVGKDVNEAAIRHKVARALVQMRALCEDTLRKIAPDSVDHCPDCGEMVIVDERLEK